MRKSNESDLVVGSVNVKKLLPTLKGVLWIWIRSDLCKFGSPRFGSGFVQLNTIQDPPTYNKNILNIFILKFFKKMYRLYIAFAMVYCEILAFEEISSSTKEIQKRKNK